MPGIYRSASEPFRVREGQVYGLGNARAIDIRRVLGWLVAQGPRLGGGIGQASLDRNRREMNPVVLLLWVVLPLNDAALVTVKLRGSGDPAARHPHQFFLAIDAVGDAVLLIVRHHPVTAIAKGFRRVAKGDEHRGAEHLRIPRKAELDRSADRLPAGYPPEKQPDKRKDAFAHRQSISSG
jgi:hypothetical protein